MNHASPRIGRLPYIALVIIGAFLASMAYPSVVLRMKGMSEAAGGAALIWMLSVPSTLVIAFIASRYTYTKYITSESVSRIAGLFTLTILTAPLVGILLTYSALYLFASVK
nr:hypothetical protein [uncultured bacterium]